jgi:hypothetical protein
MIRAVFNLFQHWTFGRRERPAETRADHFVYWLPFLTGQGFRVVQGYGGAYSHTGEEHFSIDFEMPEGTPICAARAGVVYRVTDHFSEGGPHSSFKPKANSVCLLHSDDTVAAYVHLAHHGACVRPGAFVNAGEVVGLAGSTGWSSSPHLHFHVADAITHQRIPTWFDTLEGGVTIVEAGDVYARPPTARRGNVQKSRSSMTGLHESPVPEPRSASYYPDLLELGRDVRSELSTAGYEDMSDYSSVESLPEVYGLEVCGIRTPEMTLDIVRFLLRRFPGWNAKWFGPPDDSAAQEWVASVQRDRDPLPEYWETD